MRVVITILLTILHIIPNFTSGRAYPLPQTSPPPLFGKFFSRIPFSCSCTMQYLCLVQMGVFYVLCSYRTQSIFLFMSSSSLVVFYLFLSFRVRFYVYFFIFMSYVF